MEIDQAALEQAAKACRAGLMGQAERAGSMFKGFPRGACGPASEILGRLLQDELGYEGVYVSCDSHPQLGDEQTHAWFEVGEFLIDITHDQFKGTGLQGWVFDRGNEWHAQFSERDQRPGACTPEHWPCYPHDDYEAALAEYNKSR